LNAAYSEEPTDRFGSISEPISRAQRMRVMAAVLALRSPRQGRGFMARGLAHLSDEALVALVARADEDALAELYDRFNRVAYGLALRIVRDPSLAEDAVQDAFLAVWRSAARFVAERAKASTWILTLVHRRAVDLVRREQPRRAEPLESAPQQAGDDTEEEAWRRLRRTRVQEALKRLPDKQREAIELAYYGGFTQSELADRLGEPLGTIKSRMFSGLANLRDLLAEGDIEREQWKEPRSTT
jgi:RNA polymerase sigma-70 factor, ECF subfamily